MQKEPVLTAKRTNEVLCEEAVGSFRSTEPYTTEDYPLVLMNVILKNLGVNQGG